MITGCGMPTAPRTGRAVFVVAACLATTTIAVPGSAAAVTLTTTVADSALTVSLDGFVSTYYSYVVQNPLNGVSAGRLFASRHNSITISGASFGVELRYGSAFAYVAPWFGLTPSTIYSGEPTALPAASVGPSDATVWRYLREANAGFEFEDWKVDAGLFVSPIGIEGIAEKDNWLWSSSWQNYLFPFYHFGARVHHQLSDDHTLGFWLVNGFTGAVDNNDAKSIIVTAAGPIGPGQWQVLYYGGDERPDPASGRKDPKVAWLHHLDAWASIPITNRLQVAGQVDFGFEPNELGVAWYAAASGYARFAFSDMLAAAARLEIYGEQTASEGEQETSPLFAATDWIFAFTVAVEVKPIKNAAVRLEYRHDQAQNELFFDDALTPDAKGQDAFTFGLTVWI